jgi:WhiB family redox-sensing transcriptional regulator
VESSLPQTAMIGWWQMAWLDLAGCLGQDPELFFPVGTTGPALDQISRAKAECARCPVRAQCLEWSLASHQDHGIWGGATEEERRAIGQARRRGERSSRSRRPPATRGPEKLIGNVPIDKSLDWRPS